MARKKMKRRVDLLLLPTQVQARPKKDKADYTDSKDSSNIDLETLVDKENSTDSRKKDNSESKIESAEETYTESFIKNYKQIYISKSNQGFKDTGRSSNRRIIAFSILLLCLGLIGSVSVVGLLQSTERIGVSGLIIGSPPPAPDDPPSPPSPPTEPTVEIDVYSDSACTQVLSNVAWGSIQAGGSTTEIVYIKNSGDNNVTLSFTTENWTPASAENYMALSWNYDGRDLGAGEVLGVTLTLSVSASITGIDIFSFDIVLIGSAA